MSEEGVLQAVLVVEGHHRLARWIAMQMTDTLP